MFILRSMCLLLIGILISNFLIISFGLEIITFWGDNDRADFEYCLSIFKFLGFTFLEEEFCWIEEIWDARSIGCLSVYGEMFLHSSEDFC
jgi:hypothetical protein